MLHLALQLIAITKLSIESNLWVCILWQKWLETATDKTFETIFGQRFDDFPGATNNYFKMFISEVKTSNGEEFLPRILYHIAASQQFKCIWGTNKKEKVPIAFFFLLNFW